MSANELGSVYESSAHTLNCGSVLRKPSRRREGSTSRRLTRDPDFDSLYQRQLFDPWENAGTPGLRGYRDSRGTPPLHMPDLAPQYSSGPLDTDPPATNEQHLDVKPVPDDRDSIPQPIGPGQLIAEVKGIYAGLIMVEAKCVEVDNHHQSSTENALNHQQSNNDSQFPTSSAQEHQSLDEYLSDNFDWDTVDFTELTFNFLEEASSQPTSFEEEATASPFYPNSHTNDRLPWAASFVSVGEVESSYENSPTPCASSPSAQGDFRCNVSGCTQTLKSRSSLNKHMKGVHSKPRPCPACRVPLKIAGRQDNLFQHLKRTCPRRNEPLAIGILMDMAIRGSQKRKRVVDSDPPRESAKERRQKKGQFQGVRAPQPPG